MTVAPPEIRRLIKPPYLTIATCWVPKLVMNTNITPQYAADAAKTLSRVALVMTDIAPQNTSVKTNNTPIVAKGEVSLLAMESL